MQVFIFLPSNRAQREAYASALHTLQTTLSPSLRFFLCGATACAALLRSFGLLPVHAPTAIAHDAHGLFSDECERWRLIDHPAARQSMKATGLSMTPASLTAFANSIASSQLSADQQSA